MKLLGIDLALSLMGLGSIPGQGTKILQAVSLAQKKKKKKRFPNIVFFPIHKRKFHHLSKKSQLHLQSTTTTE